MYAYPPRALACQCTMLGQVGQIKVKTAESLDFSTEDTVPGSMWLPIALRDVPTGDPWVTMCLIDYRHYQVRLMLLLLMLLKYDITTPFF